MAEALSEPASEMRCPYCQTVLDTVARDFDEVAKLSAMRRLLTHLSDEHPHEWAQDMATERVDDAEKLDREIRGLSVGLSAPRLTDLLDEGAV